MAYPVEDPEFWKSRIVEGISEGRPEHWAVGQFSLGDMARVNNAHREILASLVGPQTSILDAGCGYGRLLEVLPSTWSGNYVGIDVSPDLVAQGRLKYPDREFICGNIRDCQPLLQGRRFDLAIMVGVRSMIQGNLGADVWEGVQASVLSVAPKLLVLEPGVILHGERPLYEVVQ